MKHTQLEQMHTLCNPCTRLQTSPACIQFLHHSRKSGRRQSRLQAPLAPLSPFLGVLLLWHVVLGIIKVDISSFGGRLVLLRFTFRLPFAFVLHIRQGLGFGGFGLRCPTFCLWMLLLWFMLGLTWTRRLLAFRSSALLCFRATALFIRVRICILTFVSILAPMRLEKDLTGSVVPVLQWLCLEQGWR